MYTIHVEGGDRDLTIENSLSGLESEFTNIRENKLANCEPLALEERVALCAFVAAMQARSQAHRDHWSQQWGQVAKRMEQIAEAMKDVPRDERHRMLPLTPSSTSGQPMTYSDVKELEKSHLQNNLISTIQMMIPILFRMDMVVFCTSSLPGFITSDKPCVWYDSEAHKRPPMFREPALGYRTTEVTLPVSPQQLLNLNWQGISGYIKMEGSELVEEFNRRTRFGANNEFVVSQDIKKDTWFDPGTPSDESEIG